MACGRTSAQALAQADKVDQRNRPQLASSRHSSNLILSQTSCLRLISVVDSRKYCEANSKPAKRTRTLRALAIDLDLSVDVAIARPTCRRRRRPLELAIDLFASTSLAIAAGVELKLELAGSEIQFQFHFQMLLHGQHRTIARREKKGSIAACSRGGRRGRSAQRMGARVTVGAGRNGGRREKKKGGQECASMHQSRAKRREC